MHSLIFIIQTCSYFFFLYSSTTLNITFMQNVENIAKMLQYSMLKCECFFNVISTFILSIVFIFNNILILL